MASEAGDMWVNVQGSLVHVFLPIPQVKNQHLDGAEQAAPPGVVHVDVAAPCGSEEAAGSISQDTQDTQIQWSLFSWFQVAPQTVFFFSVSCGFSQ